MGEQADAIIPPMQPDGFSPWPSSVLSMPRPGRRMAGEDNNARSSNTAAQSAAVSLTASQGQAEIDGGWRMESQESSMPIYGLRIE
jgi:hypothetical protein